jgi:hypothetical protein
MMLNGATYLIISIEQSHMKISVYIIILFCSIILSCCKDSDPPTPTPPVEEQLPPITTTGAGTFGCKVNGKVWVAKSNKTGWLPTYGSVNKQNEWHVNVSGNIVLGNNTDDLINVTFYNTFSSYYPLYIKKDSVAAAKFIDVVTNKFWRTDSLIGGG